MAETWKANKEKIPEAQKFDWTYSTKYRGTATKGGASWDPEPTERKIDFESLKVGLSKAPISCHCVSSTRPLHVALSSPD